MANEALRESGKAIPLKDITIGMHGEIKSELAVEAG
jgi:hypothetical protein